MQNNPTNTEDVKKAVTKANYQFNLCECKKFEEFEEMSDFLVSFVFSFCSCQSVQSSEKIFKQNDPDVEEKSNC